ncbi:PfkB family carbohydrate kinase [Streptomyces sp. NPDC026672]|uniref:carbohydrate kinase family protein n=1 Tax=unclassified Streptomyces TaxID=2593676 RepID=UPI003408D31D
MAPAGLVALGDALADLVVPVGPEVCERLGVAPGTAGFLELEALEKVLARLEGEGARPVVSAGGSAANTCVAFAAGGGRAVLATASMDDPLARAIRDDLAVRGVTVPAPSPGRGRTGRCLVLLLPDGERSFLIWQGERWRLRLLPGAVEACLAGDGSWQGVLAEGYLLASEEGCEAVVEALRRAAALGAARVLALSDRRLVRAQRRRFAQVLAAGVDVVLGNGAEAMALTGTDDAEAAAAVLAGHGMLGVVTLGPGGAVAHGPGGRHRVTARGGPVMSAIGAGDAFAGGFLYGLLSELEHSACLGLGAERAHAVLGVRQARAPVPRPARDSRISE